MYVMSQCLSYCTGVYYRGLFLLRGEVVIYMYWKTRQTFRQRGLCTVQRFDAGQTIREVYTDCLRGYMLQYFSLLHF